MKTPLPIKVFHRSLWKWVRSHIIIQQYLTDKVCKIGTWWFINIISYFNVRASPSNSTLLCLCPLCLQKKFRALLFGDRRQKQVYKNRVPYMLAILVRLPICKVTLQGLLSKSGVYFSTPWMWAGLATCFAQWDISKGDRNTSLKRARAQKFALLLLLVFSNHRVSTHTSPS